jgi:hypothetical protein
MRKIRLSAGALALATGLWLLSTANAAPPALSKDVYKKAIAADVAYLQEALKGGAPAKGAMRTIKAVAMFLATYGEATGDTGLTTEALKVAEAMAKKDYKGAEEAAKGLTGAKGGTKPKGPLHTLAKFDLEDAMSPYRLGRLGGLNMEKDIRDAIKAGTIDAKTAELIGIRTAVIADYATHYPNEKATTNKMLQGKWDGWSKEMGELGKQLADEAGKAKADQKALNGILKKLDANCLNCHNAFRDN